MTPAVNIAKKLKLDFNLHQYQHDPNAESYGQEAAEKLGINSEQVFKTLVAEKDTGELIVAIVPVDKQLSFKLLAKAAKCKKVQMAKPEHVQKSTGYVLGGVSPLGQKKRLPTFIDESANSFDTVFVSGGKRGLEIELSPQELCQSLNGTFAPLAS
ncbi:Cys-tRNA(Pro) deacylase [Thalassotalea euphylliae]|uniref:Cys-tRNA(Pro) deacylase n=1 Tax=Thalassotalea euphylliae TaxID=1655234 RepID=UPI0036399FD1